LVVHLRSLGIRQLVLQEVPELRLVPQQQVQVFRQREPQRVPGLPRLVLELAMEPASQQPGQVQILRQQACLRQRQEQQQLSLLAPFWQQLS
jgi:hypothetical protein